MARGGATYRRVFGLRTRIVLWILFFSLVPLAAMYNLLNRVLESTNVLIVKDAVDFTERKAFALRAAVHANLQKHVARDVVMSASVFRTFLAEANGDVVAARRRLTNEMTNEAALALFFDQTGRLLNREQLPSLPPAAVQWADVVQFLETNHFIYASADLAPAEGMLLLIMPLGVESIETARALRWREDFARDVQSTLKRTTSRLNLIAVSLLLVLGLAAIVLSRRLTRTITRPLETLAQAMEEFDGTQQTDLVTHRRDEVGLLTNQFAEMTGKLVTARRELAEKQEALERADFELMRLNLTLEERILERTAELEDAMAKLRELDKNKDDFISLVSHELKTPLTSISASAEALLSKDLKLPETDREKLLAIVRYEAERLSRLINVLLDMSRLEAGRMIFNYRITNLAALVRQNAEAYRLAIEQKGLHLEVEIASDQRLRRALCDADRVVQALTNLLSNAIKYTERGRITVTLNITETANQPLARLVVADTGIGIRPEDNAKVFDRFQQIERIDTHHEGLGLGMPLSKMLVEAMGGEIHFASRPNHGTAFTVMLPLDRPPGKDPTLPAAFNEDFES
jgi:signal transduction histidine kinase